MNEKELNNNMILSSSVIYLPKITIAEQYKAQLEWSDDGRVKYSYRSNSFLTVLFDVPVSEIQSVKASPNSVLFIKVAGKTYRAYFDPGVSGNLAVTPALGILGIFTLINASRKNKASGIYNWTEAFKKHGVKTSSVGMGAIVAISLVIVVLIFAGIYIFTL